MQFTKKAEKAILWSRIRFIGKFVIFAYKLLSFRILHLAYPKLVGTPCRPYSSTLQNMFMAILNDTYSEVKEEVENRKEDFQMLDFLKRGYNNVREVISERDKLLDIQTTVKLAADDGVVTFDEIRENLRKLNFSDAEIEIFCAKYDRNGDFMFTLDEINAIEEGLEDEMENDGQPINEVDMVPKVSLVTGEKLKEEKLPTPNQGMLDE